MYLLRRNKGIKRICPSCIEEFYPGDCEIVSRVPYGVPLKSAPLPGPQQDRARRNPEPLTGPKYTKALACRKCPFCGYLLPYNIELVNNRNIVIVGDTSSGKSMYIATLIDQIERGKMYRPDQYAVFNCLTKKVEREYKDKYTDPLFLKKETPPPTQPAKDTTHEPLIYELSIKASEHHLPQNMNLLIYDTSGEDYVIEERLVAYSPYVLNADAIIFLADPTTMPEIYDRVKDRVHYSTQQRSATVSFNTIIQPFTRYRNKQTGALLRSIPIAITLSKSDLLKYDRSIHQQYNFLKNSSYTNGLDLKDIDIVDEEVREVLREHGDSTLINAAQGFEKVKFLAISATGWPPDKDGKLTAVEPRRCLDPLLWVFHELGIIAANTTV